MEIDFAYSVNDLFTTMTFPHNQTVQYVHLSKLTMKDGVQRVKINTKNALGISSEHVFYNVSLYTLPPVRNSKCNSQLIIVCNLCLIITLIVLLFLFQLMLRNEAMA